MPVDFFIAPCEKPDGNCKKTGVICKKTTNESRFGLSDENAHKREPAFLDLNNELNWDATVLNPENKEVTFKAVDFCVDIFREGRDLIKRCEGFLFYENKILFVEVKRGKTGRWLSDAREKLQETISKFKESYPGGEFEILEPVVSNKLFYRTHQNEQVQKKMLKDAIGVDFHVRTTITIN